MEYEITNAFVSAKIEDFGAQLCSLRRNAVDIEYIWQADEKYWSRHAPILFPIVGKLLDDEYIYDNQTYHMKQHGFARDMLFEVLEHKRNYICFKLEQDETTLKSYPFNFRLYITYTLLENCLKVSYKVVNKSSCSMPFSIGAHPAFNWPLHNERKTDYCLKFKEMDTLHTLPLTKEGISQEKKEIALCNRQLPLTKKLFKNDALIVENMKTKSILFKNNLNDKFVKVTFDGFEYLGIWSKPTGAPFICIEPWHGIADFIGHNKKIEEKKGMKFLEPEEVFESAYTIEI